MQSLLGLIWIFFRPLRSDWFIFHRSRENMSERTLIVAQALIRAFGAMRLYIYVVIRKITESGYCFFGCGVI